MILKKFSIFFIVVVLGGAMLFTSPLGYATKIKFDLSGVGSSVNGFGRDGLFLGPSFSSNAFTARYNWTFNSVNLTIDVVTGVGTIHGDMTRQSDNTVWNIDIVMTDLIVRSGMGAGTSRHAYSAGNDDLASILSSNTVGSGVEWRNLNLIPTSPAPFWGNPVSTTSAWTGLTMPGLGHINVAELYVHQDYLGSGINGLIFDAWYQRADCPYCTYQIGDTKVIATERVVSLPGTLFLLAFGLIGLVTLKEHG